MAWSESFVLKLGKRSATRGGVGVVTPAGSDGVSREGLCEWGWRGGGKGGTIHGDKRPIRMERRKKRE